MLVLIPVLVSELVLMVMLAVMELIAVLKVICSQSCCSSWRTASWNATGRSSSTFVIHSSTRFLRLLYMVAVLANACNYRGVMLVPCTDTRVGEEGSPYKKSF